MIKPTDLQNTAVSPDQITTPEGPPNRLEVRNVRCLLLGHRRRWEPDHDGSEFEVQRCQRCGDTTGGMRKAGA